MNKIFRKLSLKINIGYNDILYVCTSFVCRGQCLCAIGRVSFSMHRRVVATLYNNYSDMNYQFIAFTFGDTMTYRGKADCGLPTVRFRFRNQVDVVVPFDKASVLNTESRGEDLKSSIPWLLVY